MKVEVRSSDRIGITQEILNVFSQRSWNLKAIEVELCVTYVNIDQIKLSLIDIRKSLAQIDGIISCKEIKFMPSEQRENHLQALLTKIPDPIIDIDEKGKVLTLNQSAEQLLKHDANALLGKDINDYVKPVLTVATQVKAYTASLTFAGSSCIADITPILVNDKPHGAVIMIRTAKSLGRQISMMQAEQEQGLDSIIGVSKKIKALKEQVIRFAELELPVFITGETGTGKELLARALHDTSARAKSPFLAINCAALPENLLESELFGYVQGAFTGAQRGGKPGLFELAEGGTIFLDEIGEMSVYLQAKLLRFLQDYRFRRLGGTKEQLANVRIISASHQNFETMLNNESFREDLFYRLNVLTLALPPLRERAEDIALLSNRFIENAALQSNQQLPILTESSLMILKNYPWPGNIRQLQNTLFRLVALNENTEIVATDVQSILDNAIVRQKIKSESVVEPKNSSIGDWTSEQKEFEHQLLSKLLPNYPTTRKLAQRLGVSHNKIAMKLREHGLR